LGKLQSRPSEDLEDISLILLLEFTTISLELDSGVTTEDEYSDFTELDEASSTLLLDTPVFSLELDCFTSLWVSLDEDFAFSLLDEFFWALELDELCSAAEEDSTAGSSFGPADADELSSHPTKVNAATPIAIRNFFIKPPVTRYNKFKANVIYST
jgi:hypothetical protein